MTIDQHIVAQIQETVLHARVEGTIPTITGKKFRGLVFHQLDLQGADFRGSGFLYCTFTQTQLDGTNCTAVDFTGSQFIHCSLVGTQCHSACFVDANMVECNCAGASFRKTDWSRYYSPIDGIAYVLGSLLVEMVRGEQHPHQVSAWGLPYTSLEGCNFTHTDFSEAILPLSSFRRSVCLKTNFRGADLTGTDFGDGYRGKWGMHLEGATLLGSNVVGNWDALRQHWQEGK